MIIRTQYGLKFNFNIGGIYYETIKNGWASDRNQEKICR